MFLSKVNDKIFDITHQGDHILVNGEQVEWDLLEFSPGNYHILHQGKSYRAELLEADRDAKSFIFRINGQRYTVAVKDKFDQLLEKMGMDTSAATRLNNIKAPMPGLIIDLKIKAGDQVKAGDSLLILEAMKMENVLKSPGDGLVKNVRVSKGDSVEKGQVLIEF